MSKILKIFLVIFFIFDCSNIFGEILSKKNSIKPLWEGKKTYKIEYISSVGDDDFIEKEEYFFSVITKMVCDSKNNLYILDGKSRRILKFDSFGKIIKIYKFSKGQGPKDLARPYDLKADDNENLYIYDGGLNVIKIFDKYGKLKNIIKLKGRVYNFALGKNNSFYATYNNASQMKLNIRTNHIIKTNSISGKRIKVFGRETRSQNLLNKLLPLNNLMTRIETDRKGNVYLYYVHPYEIRRYSSNGQLELRFAREANFEGPPNRRKTSNTTLSYVWRLGVFDDGKILALIRHKKVINNKVIYEFWFDLFSENGEWLISIPGDKFKINFIWNFTIDPAGCLYISYNDPFNHVKKFKITFPNIN
jgi:hypothetical protein